MSAQERRTPAGSTLAAALAALLVLGLSAVAAAAPPAALEFVKAKVQEVISILENPALDKESERKELRRVGDTLFDWPLITRRAVGQDWQAMTPEQRKETTRLFTNLLEKNYMDQIQEYSGKEQVRYVSEVMIDGDKADVETLVLSEGKDIPIRYRLYRQDNVWLVYDLFVEGASLVKNYRSQFKEMLHKGGPEGLIEQLKAKVASEGAGKGRAG
jgi:phospholipid transport system substrate-binding protein